MNDAYQNLSEMLDNWLSDRSKDIKMALIEKEILLEKMRKLYVQLSALEVEEYEAPVPATDSDSTNQETKKQFSPAKTLEDDVELFFDTEHESYKNVEEELKEIADEIQDAQKTTSSHTETNESKQPETNSLELDIFDQIEQSEEPAETPENNMMEDDASELFMEPDFEISTEPESGSEPAHEEDDILQFMPPKSTPVGAETEQIPQPAEKQKVEEPRIPKQNPVQLSGATKAATTSASVEPPVPKPQQRSLNDLFNEKREDHSISSQYQHAKVGDLTKAISINDKFIYIKELFHNRGEDFSTSIRQLNECKNMEEAFDCLEKLKQKFFWDSKSDAYLSFCDLLRRKYS